MFYLFEGYISLPEQYIYILNFYSIKYLIEQNSLTLKKKKVEPKYVWNARKKVKKTIITEIYTFLKYKLTSGTVFGSSKFCLDAEKDKQFVKRNKQSCLSAFVKAFKTLFYFAFNNREKKKW